MVSTSTRARARDGSGSAGSGSRSDRGGSGSGSDSSGGHGNGATSTKVPNGWYLVREPDILTPHQRHAKERVPGGGRKKRSTLEDDVVA